MSPNVCYLCLRSVQILAAVVPKAIPRLLPRLWELRRSRWRFERLVRFCARLEVRERIGASHPWDTVRFLQTENQYCRTSDKNVWQLALPLIALGPFSFLNTRDMTLGLRNYFRSPKSSSRRGCAEMPFFVATPQAANIFCALLKLRISHPLGFSFWAVACIDITPG